MTDPAGSGLSDDLNAAVLSFKSDLNAFRQRHPGSGYGTLEKVLGRGTYGPESLVSSTTLNDATHPLKPLPTSRTVRAMVLALTGGDKAAAQEWVDRRNQVDDTRQPTPPEQVKQSSSVTAAASPPPAASEDFPPPAPPQQETLHRRQRRGRRIALWTAVAIAALIVLAATNVSTYLLTRPVSAATQPPAHGNTGDNPLNSPCEDDSEVAISTRANAAFLLEVIYSAACDAAWARITRTDDQDSGNEIRVTLYRRAEPNGPSRQRAVEPDAHSAFTTMIVRSSPTDRLCAVGTVTTVERPDATGRPLCL